MDIRDNTTTSVTVQFSDSALIAGSVVSVRSQPLSDKLNYINLGQQSGCFFYKNRLGWFGERQSIYLVGDVGFRNLAFDGGFSSGRPLGWTEKVAGESQMSGALGPTGQGLTITGNGTNMRGVLENKGTFMATFPTGVDIHCRARMKKSNSAGTTAQFLAYFGLSTDGATTVPSGFGSITANSLSFSEFRWVDFVALTAANNTVGTTHVLRIASGGTESSTTALPNGESFHIDRLEFYSVLAPFNTSLIRWSKAGEPDAYDDLNGTMTVGQGDGQIIMGGFVLGDSCYIVKERSIYAIRDDGTSEPSNWSIDLVSNTKGSPSPNGWGIGDRWAVIASRTGLHFFDGGRPVYISKELRGLWARINWQADFKVWVGVDTERRRIHIGVPLDGATDTATVISLEYPDDAPVPSNPYIQARRDYNRWFTSDGSALTCFALSERSDGTRHTLFGTNHTNGIVARIDDALTSDFTSPIAINSRYRTAYSGSPDGRSLWGYLTTNVQGSGTFTITGYLPDNITTVNSSNRGAPAIRLQNPYFQDVEWTVDVTSERMSWEFATNATGSWWGMQKFVGYVKAKPWSKLRGTRGSS
jgi:hypothetical protein